MERKLIINKDVGYFEELEPVKYAKNDPLKIKIDTKIFHNCQFYVTIEKDKEITTLIANDNVIEVPTVLYCAGVLKFSVEVYYNSQLLKRYCVGELIIKEAETQYFVMSDTEDLKMRLKRCEKALTEIYNQNKNKGDLGLWILTDL